MHFALCVAVRALISNDSVFVAKFAFVKAVDVVFVLENVGFRLYGVIAVRASEFARRDIEVHIRAASFALYDVGRINFFVSLFALHRVSIS